MPQKAAKIILADAHAILRAGLNKILEDYQDEFCVVGEVSDGEKLFALLKQTVCDVIILDIVMPKVDGLQLIKHIKQAYPNIHILVLTRIKDRLHFRQAMRFGVSGYLLKEEPCQKLIAALREVCLGGRYVSSHVSDIVMNHFLSGDHPDEAASPEVLTKTERVVLEYIAKGLQNKQIAGELDISRRTVETHRSHIHTKLGIKNTAGLVKYAMHKGLACT